MYLMGSPTKVHVYVSHNTKHNTLFGQYVHVHVIVVSWFLQCMEFVQHEGKYYPMHCKNHNTTIL